MAVPLHAAIRSDDGPVHRSKAIDEERGGATQDQMLRLEPRDIALFAQFVGGLAKAYERFHLVAILLDRAHHHLQLAHVAVGREREQMPLAMAHAPHDPIHEAPLARAAMTCAGFQPTHQVARDFRVTG